MATDSVELLALRLSPSEAMTVLAAVRQYEPYWSGSDDPQAVATKLHAIRSDVDSVVAKIRDAAGKI